jgi:hypothetical protein
MLPTRRRSQLKLCRSRQKEGNGQALKVREEVTEVTEEVTEEGMEEATLQFIRLHCLLPRMSGINR